LQFGLRLGPHPRCIVTTTPRPTPTLISIFKDAKTVVTKGNTYENRANLASSFIARLKKKYDNTRLGRQEIAAEILGDVPGALWTRDLLEERRVDRAPPDLQRIVVAVDPSGSHGKDDPDFDEGDDIGIVVAGQTVDRRVYVLEDATVNVGPLQWAQKICQLYKDYMADLVVAEVNFGAAMVGALLRTVDPTISFKEMHATRGKFLRAEPVAGLYQQGMVKHVGMFPKLEDEMIAMKPEGYQGGGSPNRLDAMVWAVTELSLENVGRTGSVSFRV
jgi:phage terminase large subunit-like protein